MIYSVRPKVSDRSIKREERYEQLCYFSIRSQPRDPTLHVVAGGAKGRTAVSEAETGTAAARSNQHHHDRDDGDHHA